MLAAMQLPHREKSIMGQICWFEGGMGSMISKKSLQFIDFSLISVGHVGWLRHWTRRGCGDGDGRSGVVCVL